MSGIRCGDRLLVIGNEPAFGRSVKRVAEDCGFDVMVTQIPSAFINAARKWQPTVILLDLKVPGCNGIELLRALAADQNTADVVLSSGADVTVLDAAMQLGRDRGLSMGTVLQKPIRSEDLRERLSRLKRFSIQELSTDLAQAVAADQLYLEFQPKLDCKSSRFTGVEALVRWNHPAHGIIAPTQFIGLAEETGFVGQITDWVVAAAATQGASWRADQLALDVAVNVSARDVEDLSFPDRLERRCRDAGLDPSCMTIELTETGAMREAIRMMDVLTRLRLKGFKLSIDDFGMGYSSLVQLQRMPFSEIKIDQWFVMQMTSNHSCRVIVEIVIDLARKLGLTSVAEGVEDEAALTTLIAMGCDAAQGYHLCPPVSASRVAEFVRAQHAPGQAQMPSKLHHLREGK